MGNLSSLSELSSQGKSGSFFYFTADNKFMIKTISKDEAMLFKSILKKYFEFLNANRSSLLCRILGFHRMKVTLLGNKTNIYLIVMQNILIHSLEIDYKLDIKGSLYGRKCDP